MTQAGRRRAALRDPIEMAVLRERLLSIAESVGHVLIRGAVSSNIKERRDCSTGLFDAAGRLIAQADHMPIHIGSLLWGVRRLLETRGADGVRDGEAFICNDPYLAGGTHLPDISILTPVFDGGALRGFVGAIAHHADVGGPSPGSVSGASRSIFAEGIRLPLIRIARDGEIDEDLLTLIAENTREPMDRILDLRTQYGATIRGAALLRGAVREIGPETFDIGVQDILLHARQRIAEAVRALPDGVYRAERWLDDDGVGEDPAPLRVAATIQGEALALDFAGSGPEAKGAVNLSASSLEATAAYCVKALLDPEVPSNSGLLDAFTLAAPIGTIVNPRPPAAVAARAVTSNRLAGAIFDALRQALPPERRMAASNDSTTLLAISGWNDALARAFVYPESIGGGGGAFGDADGADAIHVHTVNSTNLPIEALEQEYPLRCLAYGLAPDSGGLGRQRGGLGIRREIVAVGGGVSVTVRSDGHKFPAPGIDGGAAGSVTRVRHVTANGQGREVGSKETFELAPGDKVVVETLGGGGAGPAAERDPGALARDLADGKVSEAAAREAAGDETVRAALARLRGAD